MNNREIKFRAWNGNEMVDLQEITPLALDANMNTQLSLQGGSGLFIPFLPDYAIMQYTGLKDKDGVEIYEGDVVKCRMSFENSSLPHIGEIVFIGQFGAFATKNQAGETLLHNHQLNTFEVIGNIYESPKLLEV